MSRAPGYGCAGVLLATVLMANQNVSAGPYVAESRVLTEYGAGEFPTFGDRTLVRMPDGGIGFGYVMYSSEEGGFSPRVITCAGPLDEIDVQSIPWNESENVRIGLVPFGTHGPVVVLGKGESQELMEWNGSAFESIADLPIIGDLADVIVGNDGLLHLITVVTSGGVGGFVSFNFSWTRVATDLGFETTGLAGGDSGSGVVINDGLASAAWPFVDQTGSIHGAGNFGDMVPLGIQYQQQSFAGDMLEDEIVVDDPDGVYSNQKATVHFADGSVGAIVETLAGEARPLWLYRRTSENAWTLSELVNSRTINLPETTTNIGETHLSKIFAGDAGALDNAVFLATQFDIEREGESPVSQSDLKLVKASDDSGQWDEHILLDVDPSLSSSSFILVSNAIASPGHGIMEIVIRKQNGDTGELRHLTILDPDSEDFATAPGASMAVVLAELNPTAKQFDGFDKDSSLNIDVADYIARHQ